jgi:hypothetical protein
VTYFSQSCTTLMPNLSKCILLLNVQFCSALTRSRLWIAITHIFWLTTHFHFLKWKILWIWTIFITTDVTVNSVIYNSNRSICCLFVCLIDGCFNATFNNISVISWRSVLLVKETVGPGENNRPVASHGQTLSRYAVYLGVIEIRTHNIRGDSHWLHR